MKKVLSWGFVLLLGACSQTTIVEPDYNFLASHINVIGKASNYVIYEYSDIRIDEVAPIAAIYCRDNGNKVAELYDINLRPDHRRRATFICR